MAFAAFVEILKQIPARQVPAAFHRRGEPRIFNLDPVRLAAFALKLELEFSSAYRRMLVAQGRKAEGVVVARVLLIADAKQAALE